MLAKLRNKRLRDAVRKWHLSLCSRCFCKAAAVSWPPSSIGELDRHDSWQGGNWGGNVKWIDCSLKQPCSIEELQDILRSSSKVRVVGSAHSFSPLISAGSSAAPSTLVSLRQMPRLWSLDEVAKTVTVDGATTYSELCNALSSTSLALPNVASLPQFSIAGAVATGTHGSSGMGADGRLLNCGLADAVAEVVMIGADGDVRRVSRGEEGFECSVVSLGMLGIVIQLTLSLVDRFDVRQRVYGTWPPLGNRPGSMQALFNSLPDILSDCYSFSAFLDWTVDDSGMLLLRDKIPHESVSMSEPSPDWHGMPLRNDPISGFLNGGDMEGTGTGPWHDKLHIWMKDAKPFGPQFGPELQFEHFVPLGFASEALEKSRLVGENWGGALLYVELRAVRGGDGQVLSPTSCKVEEGEDMLAITTGMDASIGEARVLQACSVIEEALAPYAQPHWGKLTTLSPKDIRSLYGSRLDRFRQVCGAVDPQRKFSNAWLDRMILDA